LIAYFVGFGCSNAKRRGGGLLNWLLMQIIIVSALSTHDYFLRLYESNSVSFKKTKIESGGTK
jgi:hypothetical protein